MQLPDLQPGTWADWANAAATALAFTVALLLFFIGLRDRRRADQDRRRQQARRVWIWPEAVTGEAIRPGLMKQDSIDFRIENKSAEPILACEASIAGAFGGNPIQPGVKFDLIRPGDTMRGTLRYGVTAPEGARPLLELLFHDSAGVLWLRDSFGMLTYSPKVAGGRG